VEPPVNRTRRGSVSVGQAVNASMELRTRVGDLPADRSRRAGQ
jgi:hypothetical protein